MWRAEKVYIFRRNCIDTRLLIHIRFPNESHSFGCGVAKRDQNPGHTFADGFSPKHKGAYKAPEVEWPSRSPDNQWEGCAGCSGCGRLSTAGSDLGSRPHRV